MRKILVKSICGESCGCPIWISHPFGNCVARRPTCCVFIFSLTLTKALPCNYINYKRGLSTASKEAGLGPVRKMFLNITLVGLTCPHFIIQNGTKNLIKKLTRRRHDRNYQPSPESSTAGNDDVFHQRRN